jgi:hypothetical protein
MGSPLIIPGKQNQRQLCFQEWWVEATGPGSDVAVTGVGGVAYESASVAGVPLVIPRSCRLDLDVVIDARHNTTSPGAFSDWTLSVFKNADSGGVPDATFTFDVTVGGLALNITSGKWTSTIAFDPGDYCSVRVTGSDALSSMFFRIMTVWEIL